MKIPRRFLISSLFFLFLPTIKARAFPETARHGYVSCATCHYSPSGRGLLTSFGKTISRELYSSFKRDELTENQPAWWQIGGQVRLMQFIHDSPSLQKARFFPMQAELEGAIDKETWAFVGSIGAWRPIEASSQRYRPYSRNVYLLLRPSESWILRIGHFRISHGLGLPDHPILVSEGLGWTHSHETNNLEVNYLQDDKVIQLSFVSPSVILATNEQIHGASVTFDHGFLSKHKIGFNLSRFKRSGVNESQANIHAILAISDESFFQFEIGQRNIEASPQLSQRALFSRYSHEMTSGLRAFAQWEYAILNQSASQKAQRYYLGTEWFPIHYFDLMTSFGREMDSRRETTTVLNMIGHFYF